MTNKLPEKLTLLRKHYGYSQGDMANKLHIPVTEYMNWENGNSICGIQQLKILADLFHVPLDAMADNTKDIVIPEDTLGDSVNIPFLNGAGSSMTQQMDVADNMMPVSGVLPADTKQQTLKLNTVSDENLGSTKAINTIHDAEEKTAPEEEQAAAPVKKSIKNTNNKKKKKTMIIVAAICAIAIAAVIGFIVLNKKNSTSLSVGTVNRLAEGDKYTLYVDKNGKVQTYGTFTTGTSFTEAVQVSAYGSRAAALKKDGTVITSDGSTEVEKWSGIKMIAVGKTHTVGLKSDGTVVCTGDTNACAVTDWTNIQAVYAGNSVTIGLESDGSLITSGSVNTAVSNQKDVASITMNDYFLTITKKDGVVNSYAIGSKAVIATSSFSNVTSTAVGTSAIVGLKKDGTVAVSTSNSTLEKSISGWTNIASVAAYGDTYVAVDKNGTLYGAGDNTYSQYGTSATATPTATAATTKLSTPQNIKTELTTANLTIKWDSVENANYYQVTITGKDVIKAANNSTSVACSELVDGQEYTISVVACSDKSTQYPNSDAAKITYTYKTLSQKLATPANIKQASANNTTWTITWDSVDNADYYTVSLDGGDEVKTTGVNENSISFDRTAYTTLTKDSPHNIAVTAYSNSTAYTKSDTGKATSVKLTVNVYKVKIQFVSVDNDGYSVYASNGAELPLEEGKYSASKYLPKDIASGYRLVDTEATFVVANAGTIQISITKQAVAG